MHPAFLYLPGARLSLPELAAARLDGHLVDLGDAYIPADLVEGSALRAASLASLVQPGTAAAGPSAAWVHGARNEPPARHHLRRAVTRRIRPVQSPRVVYHDSVMPEEDLLLLGGVTVVAAERTMVDLAIGLQRDPGLLIWMQALAELDPTLAPAAIPRIESWHRVPGSRAALIALERLVVRKT